MTISPISIILPLTKLTFGNNISLPYDIIYLITKQVVWWNKLIVERQKECYSLCCIQCKHVTSWQFSPILRRKSLQQIACSIQARKNLFKRWDQLLLNGHLPQEPTSNTPKMTIAWLLQWKQTRGIE